MRILHDKAGGRPLTWQQVVVAICLCGLFASYVILFNGSVSPKTLSIGWWILYASLISGVGAIVSHFIAWHRRDLEPDLLPQVILDKEIFQAGDAHFSIDITQAGHSICVYLTVQNRRNGEGTFHFDLMMLAGPTFTTQNPFPVTLPLLPAELVACRVDMPFNPVAANTTFQAHISTSCKSSGRCVRFKRRYSLSRKPSKLIVGAALLTGHVLHEEYATVELVVSPDVPTNHSTYGGIRRDSLWRQNETIDLKEFRQRVKLLRSSSIPCTSLPT